MKNSILNICMAMMLTLSACDFLDVEPQQSLTPDQFPTNEDDLRTLLNGIRGLYQDEDLAGSNFILLPDIMGNHVNWTGSFTSYSDLSKFQQTPTNAESSAMWNNGYDVINNCNILLESIERIGLTGAAADELRGEAFFFRGAVYFEFARWFGKAYNDGSPTTNLAVPIVTTSVTSLDQLRLPARNTVQEVYDRAIADLTEAATLLGDPVDKALPSSFAAQAYLMRIRMQQQDYQNVVSLTEPIVSSGQFALTGEIATYFSVEYSSESIYEVSHTVLDNIGVNSCLPCVYGQGSARDDANYNANFMTNVLPAVVTDAQAMVIEGAGHAVVDKRSTDLIGPNNSGSAVNRIYKYEDWTNFADNAPAIRYAEVLLSRAEALARVSGLNQESVDLLNEVRARALRVVNSTGGAESNAPLLFALTDFATADELVDAILRERSVELSAEGHRLHDLKRLELDFAGLGGAIAWNADGLVLPIPQTEIDANSNIIQNSGY